MRELGDDGRLGGMERGSSQMNNAWVSVAGWQGPPLTADEAEITRDYETITRGTGILRRLDRGLIRVNGADRLTWLHNLSTNQIKTLQPGEGQYTFFLNVQGRIVLDAVVLVDRESVLLDVDRRFRESAVKHLSKYVIVEDILLTDETDRTARISVLGRTPESTLTNANLAHANRLPCYGHFSLPPPTAAQVFRTDFCGELSVDLAVAVDQEKDWLRRLTASPEEIREVCAAAVQIRRIEAGIPWPGAELTDEYLPAETRQLARAVSFNKGCYLGQEVVERMRSRGVVARQLVGLRIADGVLPPAGSQVFSTDGKAAGVLTSSCRSPSYGGVIALGYVKTALAGTAQVLKVASNGDLRSSEVVPVPFLGGVEG